MTIKREGTRAVPKRRVGRRCRTYKENAQKEKKRIKGLVGQAFKHYEKNELYKEQFIKYFRSMGMSKKETDQLWINAYAMNIIEMERRPLISEERQPRILGHVIVLTLVDKQVE